MGGATLEAIVLHSERGELARNIALALAVVALLAVFVLLPPDAPAATRDGDADPGAAPAATPDVPDVPGGRAVAIGVAAVLALAGVTLVVTTVLAGHTGSSAVWSEIGAA